MTVAWHNVGPPIACLSQRRRCGRRGVRVDERCLGRLHVSNSRLLHYENNIDCGGCRRRRRCCTRLCGGLSVVFTFERVRRKFMFDPTDVVTCRDMVKRRLRRRSAYNLSTAFCVLMSSEYFVLIVFGTCSDCLRCVVIRSRSLRILHYHKFRLCPSRCLINIDVLLYSGGKFYGW